MPERLAEIVIETGLADRSAVLRAAAKAEEQKEPLVVALVEHEGVDELALVAAIKRHTRVSIIDPAQVEHDSEALRQVSRDVCRRLRVIPLACEVFDSGVKTLRLAMADPTDTVTIAEVEHITGCQVESALMPLSAIEELVETGYRSYVTEVIPRKAGSEGEDGPAPKPALTPAVRELQNEPSYKPQLITGSSDRTSRTVGAPRASDRPSDSKSPTTVPFHRVTDEASLELRHRALLELLVKKNVLTEEEYSEELRSLMKRRADEQ